VSSAREEFGPKRNVEIEKLMENTRLKGEVLGAGNTLNQAGLKQDGHAQLSLVKNDNSTKNEVKKDLTVAQGDRPALTPCDGNMQAKEAGQTMKNAGATGGQGAKEFAPSQTPPAPQQSQGRNR
jgi:hypothetical protein